MVYNGEVTCQSLTGKLAILRLGTHNFRDDQDMAEEQVREMGEWTTLYAEVEPLNKGHTGIIKLLRDLLK